MPMLRILCYNGSLVIWTVVSLTTAKFKPLIFCMSGFTFSYTANMFMISYDFWLSPTQYCYIIVYLSFTYIAEERTWTYSKRIWRDLYPASLLARRWDLQKTHVTWSLSTVVTSPRIRKTQLPLLLRDLTTHCLQRIYLPGNLFTNTLPSNGCTCNSMLVNMLVN
jgi:hypothetical protein